VQKDYARGENRTNEQRFKAIYFDANGQTTFIHKNTQIGAYSKDKTKAFRPDGTLRMRHVETYDPVSEMTTKKTRWYHDNGTPKRPAKTTTW
jgi:hypothetical protein